MLYLENAKNLFAKACGVYDKYNVASNFYHRLATMIPDKIDVDSLILAFKIAFNDSEKVGENTLSFLALVPKYIEQISSYEFAHEFRMKYLKEILGLDVNELPNVDYGINEVEEDIIDISNKDKYEVLAALYNNSTPIGMGFANYNPLPWDAQMAKLFWDYEFSKNYNDEGRLVLKYVLGRPLNCIFQDNYVYVKGYNDDNEQGLGQRVIATVPNKENVNNMTKK